MAKAKSQLSSSFFNRYSILEMPFAAPATNPHEELFGVIGSNGPAFYMQSMKLLLFTSILLLALGINILSYEPFALPLGYIELVPSLGAILLAPFTFLLYNWVTATEMLCKDDIVGQVIADSNADRFRSTLSSLTKLWYSVESFVQDHKSEARRSRCATNMEEQWSVLLEREEPLVMLDIRALFNYSDRDGSGLITRMEVSFASHVLRVLASRPMNGLGGKQVTSMKASNLDESTNLDESKNLDEGKVTSMKASNLVSCSAGPQHA